MSPIHDQTYRRYEGTRAPVGRAWTVITTTGVRAMLSKKFFLIVMVGAWIQFIVRCVQIYVVHNYPATARFAPIDGKMFETFLEIQDIFVFFLTIYAGAGLIANDRRANALQIYLSKPLLRMEYIGGKLAVLLTYLASVTLLPALLLILVEIMFSGSFSFVTENFYIIPAVTLGALLRIVVAGTAMLALSSLSKSSRYVGVLFTGVIFFTNAIFGLMRIITGSSRVAWISIGANLDQVSDAIFRQPPRYEVPVMVSALVLAGVVAVSISVLERRVRGVEVVS